jgi:hypothetical protein
MLVLVRMGGVIWVCVVPCNVLARLWRVWLVLNIRATFTEYKAFITRVVRCVYLVQAFVLCEV